MSISLSIGGQDLSIHNMGDLLSQNTATTLLSIADSVIAVNLNNPVSQFPKGSNAATLNYDGGNNSWTVGNFTFGLSGKVSGSISILQGGQTLVSYTKTFPTTIGDDLGTNTNSATTDTITVPSGQFYIQVELDMTLAANAAANVSLGTVGISGSVGNNDTFKVSFSKLVAGNTSLQAALIAALEGFVLPLHLATYQQLMPGDYLYHQFNATLNLGFGATYGLDNVFFSGQYKGDIPATPAAPSVNTSVKLEVNAGATFGATFKYTGSFEAMIWKTDVNIGRFHLYKNKATDANLNLGTTVTVIANPSVTVNAANLQQLSSQVFPGGTGAVVGQLLSGNALSQVNNWVSDIQTKIASWLKPFQQGSTQLQAAIDNTTSSFLLTDFTFDLTKAGFGTAWAEAVAGDFCAALAVPNGGTSLDSGSGLEDFHTQKTSLSFNLFGAFTSEWSIANINNLSVLYAGNNTFYLVENIGRTLLTSINQSKEEIDFYFAAAATSGPAGTTLSEIDLHVILRATQNKTFGNNIASVVSNATTGSTSSMLSKQILAIASQQNSTEMLEIIFKPSAYTRLSSSTVNGGNVPIMDETADISNYNAFAAACALVMANPPANFKMNPAMDYPSWKVWNIAVNDQYPPPPGSQPSRRNSGNPDNAEGYLDQRYGTSVPTALISYAFQAESDFMNLCEDLKNLGALVANNTAWNALVADLNAIIKNDLSVDFIPATALALTTCMEHAGVQPQITGPAPTAAQEQTITVTLQYS